MGLYVKYAAFGMSGHMVTHRGEVKGKLVNGVGSQYSHTSSERGVSSITNADAHTSAASSRLNWLHHRFKWTRPFRRKTKCVFCVCAIRFRTSSTHYYFHILMKLVSRPIFEKYTNNRFYEKPSRGVLCGLMDGGTGGRTDRQTDRQTDRHHNDAYSRFSQFCESF